MDNIKRKISNDMKLQSRASGKTVVSVFDILSAKFAHIQPCFSACKVHLDPTALSLLRSHKLVFLGILLGKLGGLVRIGQSYIDPHVINTQHCTHD